MLVRPGDAESLAVAIDSLVSNAAEAHALGERAARRAHAEYDLSRMVDRYVDVYQSALERRH
jgi:glycosyltransferase involved in cell wall biosynthesis